MNNALKAKLVKRLQNSFGRTGLGLTPNDLKVGLTDVRELMELLNETEKYKTLKFHCDWTLHPILNAPRVRTIIKAVDDECVNSLKLAGLNDWPAQCGADLIRISQSFVDTFLERFSLHYFESELKAFLDCHRIAKLPDPATTAYTVFELSYCQLVEDRTWENNSKKMPTKYVNRATLQLKNTSPDGLSRPGAQSLPYYLWWTFSWNDESRLVLTAESVLSSTKST